MSTFAIGIEYSLPSRARQLYTYFLPHSLQGTEMECTRLRLRKQLSFFMAMLVSLAFPAKAQRSTSEQALKSHPKFTDVTSMLECLRIRGVAQIEERS